MERQEMIQPSSFGVISRTCLFSLAAIIGQVHKFSAEQSVRSRIIAQRHSNVNNNDLK